MTIRYPKSVLYLLAILSRCSDAFDDRFFPLPGAKLARERKLQEQKRIEESARILGKLVSQCETLGDVFEAEEEIKYFRDNLYPGNVQAGASADSLYLQLYNKNKEVEAADIILNKIERCKTIKESYDIDDEARAFIVTYGNGSIAKHLGFKLYQQQQAILKQL